MSQKKKKSISNYFFSTLSMKIYTQNVTKRLRFECTKFLIRKKNMKMIDSLINWFEHKVGSLSLQALSCSFHYKQQTIHTLQSCNLKHTHAHMEDGLLHKVEDRDRDGEERRGWRVIGEEMKRVGYLAGPMVAVTLSQYLLQVISVMMVGHLGELSLSSTAIAMSLAGVTGWSLLVSHAIIKIQSFFFSFLSFSWNFMLNVGKILVIIHLWAML